MHAVIDNLIRRCATKECWLIGCVCWLEQLGQRISYGGAAQADKGGHDFLQAGADSFHACKGQDGGAARWQL